MEHIPFPLQCKCPCLPAIPRCVVGKAGNAQPLQMDPHRNQAALLQAAGSSSEPQPRGLPRELLWSCDVTKVLIHVLRHKLKGTGKERKKSPDQCSG